MLFYAVGSGLGSIAATAVYARAGWLGVCVLGAGISVAALLFWAATAPPVLRTGGRAPSRLRPPRRAQFSQRLMRAASASRLMP